MEWSRTQIRSDLLRAMRELAEQEGRTETELLDEAVFLYLNSLFYWQATRQREGVAEGPGRVVSHSDLRGRPEPRGDFLALLDRMSSRFELDPDEAMRIAVEEQKAFRQERAEREREREWRR